MVVVRKGPTFQFQHSIYPPEISQHRQPSKLPATVGPPPGIRTMSNGAPFYMPTFPFDNQRTPVQYDSPSSTSAGINGMPGSSNGRSSLDYNYHAATFQDGNQSGRMPPQYHQGSTNPYGIQQPSNIPSEFKDNFGTPYSGSSGFMAGATQAQETTHQGALTHSPGSMAIQFNDSTGTEQLASHEGTRPRMDSENMENNSEEPPKKKKKGKNGEAVGAGSGSGTEDKEREKEKEKDNRRKT